MMAETSFDTERRRSRISSRQARPFSHTAIAVLSLVLGAVLLYPVIVVLWGLFAL